MSQEKVEYKKEQKKNRKKIVRKKKVEYTVSVVVATAICVAVLGWIGYSIYTKAAAYVSANQTYTYNEIDDEAISEYLSTLSED